MIAVITLNWNSAADTLRCLRAMALLRDVPTQVMVVDNGSEPADLERLRSGIARWGLAAELVETGRNLGFGGGCNVGMRLAMERGAEFIWLLNNDAVPHPEALQAMLRVMERDRGVGAVARRWSVRASLMRIPFSCIGRMRTCAFAWVRRAGSWRWPGMR